MIATTNTLGDIITDLGAVLQGGWGLAASGNLEPSEREFRASMFEPVRCPAPDIAGKGIVNPIAAVLSRRDAARPRCSKQADRGLEAVRGRRHRILDGRHREDASGPRRELRPRRQVGRAVREASWRRRPLTRPPEPKAAALRRLPASRCLKLSRVEPPPTTTESTVRSLRPHLDPPAPRPLGESPDHYLQAARPALDASVLVLNKCYLAVRSDPGPVKVPSACSSKELARGRHPR